MKRTKRPTTNAPDIQSRAMLVGLSLSVWTARILDKKITDDVARQHAAVGDVGRYNKCLLPRTADAASYRDVMRAATEARRTHYAQTLQWDEGFRLLPTANYFAYSETMRKAKALFQSSLATFTADYPALKRAAKKRLNGMFVDEDFPTVEALTAKFGFDLEFAPVPAKGDFRVELPGSEIAVIESNVEERIRHAAGEAMQDAWKRLYDVVDHIHDRLTTPNAVFRDSMIDNARNICGVLKNLNFANDAELETLRSRVERDLTQYDAPTLRDDAKTRETVANEADGILAQMKEIFGGGQ